MSQRTAEASGAAPAAKAAPTLVILAAGMGSRYGGLKQMDPLGPNGEVLLDYTVRDAAQAGFDRVLFIIRREFEAQFREQVGSRFERTLCVDYAYQEVTDLGPGIMPPAGRTKPWGTGHALWCARASLNTPFAVLNADDFYGASSLRALGEFLKARGAAPAGSVPEYAMVGFPLGNTLSEHGAVSRGVCAVSPDGLLSSIVEHTGIQAAEVYPGGKYEPSVRVSMNCWGFTPDFLAHLDAGWSAFIRENLSAEKAEFYLPAAVNALIQSGTARVRVLPTDSQWFGVTFREDRPRVQAALAQLPPVR